MRFFGGQFTDCFSRREPRSNLFAYAKGQLSDLPRKSTEPIALAEKMVPRTLQNFLSGVPSNVGLLRSELLPVGKSTSLRVRRKVAPFFCG